MVTAPSSGAGKTSIACGVVRAFRDMGMSVQAFKAGPDYLDAGYLSAAAGRPAANLDLFLADGRTMVEDFAAERPFDVAVAEGVMGYFDGGGPGYGGEDELSTYAVASRLRMPAVLVLDAGKAGHSVAAVAAGFAAHRRRTRIRGVILNRVGSERHERICREALDGEGIPVLGAVPREAGLSLDSGPLGLVPSWRLGSGAVDAMASRIASFLDAGGLARASRTSEPLPRHRGAAGRAGRPPAAPAAPGPVVCVALDDAFGFYYRRSLENLRLAGASLRFFSPVADRALPECDALYVGGGFPEDRAAELSANSPMRASVKRFAERGGPVYAEGGGMMYLADRLSAAGPGRPRRRRMVGLIGGEAAMTGRLRVGYCRCGLLADTPIQAAAGGAGLAGHVFHYSEMRGLPDDARLAYACEGPGGGHVGPPGGSGPRRGRGGKRGCDGILAHNALASYVHCQITRERAGRFVGMAAGFSRR